MPEEELQKYFTNHNEWGRRYDGFNAEIPERMVPSVMIMYDVTNRKSFASVQYWHDLAKR